MPHDLTAFSRLGLCLLIIYSIAIAFWFPLQMRGRIMWTAAWLASPVLCLTPLIIPADSIRLRALAALVVVDLVGKIFDCARRRSEVANGPRAFWRYVTFLSPFPVLALTGEERTAARDVRTPLGTAAFRAAIGWLIVAACWFLLIALEDNATLRASFVLDHVVKMVLFTFTISVISSSLVALERLAAFETKPPMIDFWKARTPAEFWMRYNTRVQRWFARNIFLPSARAGRPAWGVILVFTVSAAFHEIMFDVATSHIDGSQAAFFLLQIPAVLLSPRLERFAKRGGLGAKAVAHSVTVVWLLVTCILFFRGVERVFPMFYAG